MSLISFYIENYKEGSDKYQIQCHLTFSIMHSLKLKVYKYDYYKTLWNIYPLGYSGQYFDFFEVYISVNVSLKNS